MSARVVGDFAVAAMGLRTQRLRVFVLRLWSDGGPGEHVVTTSVVPVANAAAFDGVGR